MLFADKCPVRLDGKVVAVTGANTGICKGTALELCRRGARVLMLCRSMDRANAAREDIVKETGAGGNVVIYQLDLASLESVRKCSAEIAEKEDKIDILVNNAGLVTPQWKTKDGFDMIFGTNHLGHFLLTELLRPVIKKAATAHYRPR